MFDIIKFLTVLALLMLSACQRRDDTAIQQPPTSSHYVQLQKGDSVEEFKLSDGTPCVKTFATAGGITCDWNYNYRKNCNAL